MPEKKPGPSHARQCEECHNHQSQRRRILCSICKKWYCLVCYKKWHIWDCQESA